MSGIKHDPNTRAAGLRAAQGLDLGPAPKLEDVQDGIEAHLQAFVDVEESAKLGKPVITPRSTAQMLRGIGVENIFGGHILTLPFSIPQGHKSHADLKRMIEGIRDKDTGINADTGTYDKATGHINADKAVAFWKEIAGPKGYVTKDDVNAFVAGKKKFDILGKLHAREVGKVINETEIRLLFDVAAQKSEGGDRVLTSDRFVAFLDGTIWQDLAKARADGTLYQPRPVGELVHEGPKKVATGLAKLAATYGATVADAGTSAQHQAALTIDSEASLDYQQAAKTLFPTIGGAMRALCPLGYG